jgi:predicted outer membrane protein
MVSESKHFKKTIKFIDTVNKPVQKIAKKITAKLTTFKKDIIKTATKTSSVVIPSHTILQPNQKQPKNDIKKVDKNKDTKLITTPTKKIS